MATDDGINSCKSSSSLGSASSIGLRQKSLPAGPLLQVRALSRTVNTWLDQGQTTFKYKLPPLFVGSTRHTGNSTAEGADQDDAYWALSTLFTKMAASFSRNGRFLESLELNFDNWRAPTSFFGPRAHASRHSSGHRRSNFNSSTHSSEWTTVTSSGCRGNGGQNWRRSCSTSDASTSNRGSYDKSGAAATPNKQVSLIVDAWWQLDALLLREKATLRVLKLTHLSARPNGMNWDKVSFCCSECKHMFSLLCYVVKKRFI